MYVIWLILCEQVSTAGEFSFLGRPLRAYIISILCRIEGGRVNPKFLGLNLSVKCSAHISPERTGILNTGELTP